MASPPPPSVRRHRPPPPRPKKEKKRGRRFGLGLIPLVLILLLVYLLAVPLYHWTKIDKVDAAPSGDRPADQPGTNYLIVGSDSRDGLTARAAQGAPHRQRAGQRTDTIMLLHTGSGADTADVDPPRLAGRRPRPRHAEDQRRLRLRRAEAAGPDGRAEHRHPHRPLRRDRLRRRSSTSSTPSAASDLPEARHERQARQPPHQEGLPARRRPDRAGLRAVAPRRPQLGDIARGGQQREVVSASATRPLSPWTFINPLRYWRINDAATGAIRIDEDMNPFDLGRFALAMTGESQTCTMPNLPAPSDPNRIVADPDRAPALFNAIIDDSTVPKKACTPTGRAR